MPIEKVPGDRRSPGRNARVPPSHPMSPPQNCLGISKSRRRHLNRAGSIKGKSAIAVARQFGGRQRNFTGERFWARGYAVSTVGFEEEQIRASIKHQEQLDAQGSDESGEF